MKYQFYQDAEKKKYHERYMKRAISLARRGMGRVSPNPMVGAVLVNKERIVGEGYHLYEKKHHAEVVALQIAGPLSVGATLYLNLEPCSHLGRTPPCANRIVEAGVKTVFVAIRDPNPLVDGKGLEILCEQGVCVYEGLCQEEARLLNEKYLHSICALKPFVLLKLALTLDGKIATSRGDSRWVTGPRSRSISHRLRYEYDAILVGVDTILKDNPSLDVRWNRRNRITKVVLDSTLRTPVKAKLFDSQNLVVIFHGRHAAEDRIQQLSQQAKLFCVDGRAGALAWDSILEKLGAAGIGSLIVEGGARIAASALSERMVQKICFLYGPKIIGANGISGVGDMSIDSLSKAVQLAGIRLRNLAPDYMIEAYVDPTKTT